MIISHSRNTIVILIACLIGLVMAGLVYARQFVFGSGSGNWIYAYHEPTAAPLWILLVVLFLLGISAVIGSKRIASHERGTLFGCFILIILIQFLVHDIYPVPLEALVRSDQANGFYSIAMRDSPAETLAQYKVADPSLPMHVRGNMPGKTLLFQLFARFTASPRIMGNAIILLSTFGALLLYGICKRMFRDERVALYAFLLYALIPARFFFFPILNTVTPVFMLLCLYLFLVYLDRKHVVWLWLLGCALYMLVLFEPSPLATGVIFVAILLVALGEKRLSRSDLGRLVLHPLLAFSGVYLAFFVLFDFDLLGAFRSVLAEANNFNQEENRSYRQWLGANTREFFYAAGTPLVVIFVYWVARILRRWRPSSDRVARWSMDTAFVMGLLVTFAAVLFLGINRGETSRLWIYLAALFPIPAALLLAATPRSALLVFFVGSTLVIQSIVALQRVDFVLSYHCQYQHTPGFEARKAGLASFATQLKGCAAGGSTIHELTRCIRAQEVSFEPYLRLHSVAISGAMDGDGERTFRGGDAVGVTIYWTPQQDSRPLKFSRRLQDSSGRQWSQTDYWPPVSRVACETLESWRRGETRGDYQDIQLPPDLPPGKYEVSLVVYDPDTGAAVLAGDQPSVRLAEINVVGAAPPPDPGSLAIPVRLDAPLSEELALIGYGVEPDTLRPESANALRLWWTALRHPTRSYQVHIELVDHAGQAVYRALEPLSIAPTDTWQEGQIVGERYPIVLDPQVASGDYRLRVSLVAPGDAASARPIEIGAVSVQSRPRTDDLPPIEHRLDMKLGQQIALRGYALDRTAEGANKLRLTLYWQALERVNGRYKVFVHVVDDFGRIVAQQDSDPGSGAAPTQTWRVGEAVTDTYELSLPDGGPYELLIGLYDPDTGQRLPVQDASQHTLPDAAIPLEKVRAP